MEGTGSVLLVGVTAAGIAVALSVATGVSSLLIPIGALGAAIPIALIYAVVTMGDADAEN